MPTSEIGLPERTLIGLPERAPARRGCGYWRFVLLALLLIGLVIAALGIFLILKQRDQIIADRQPPQVLVTRPISGTSIAAGGHLPVSARAFGPRPISSIELWVDGNLKETQNSGRPEGYSTFDAQFLLAAPPQGPHMLFVRAVNIDGIIGQSAAVTFVSGPAPSPGQLVYTVPVGAGQTLSSIGTLYGTDSATLQKVNPDLKGQEPSPGSMITVPVPSEVGSQSPIAPPPAASAGSDPIPVPDIPPLTPIYPVIHVELAAIGPIAVPSAPDGLQAQLKNCRVRLLWNDKATNEDHYEVRMAGLGTPPRTVATLAAAAGGAAWFEFPAPQPGGFSFWVEAVNTFARQPSNIAWVYVGPECPTTLATHLLVQGLDMNVGVSFDKSYCYVSFESAPERRIPADGNSFIKVQAGKGDITPWASGANGLAVPIPADGDLTILGECWGWVGTELSKLGPFSSNFPSSTWNGARQPLIGSTFQVGISIKPIGAMDTAGAPVLYTYEDPSLAVPYDLHEYGIRSVFFNTDPYERSLAWAWAGDQSKLTGFQIYLNGVAYNLGASGTPSLAPPAARSERVRLPRLCGEHIRWQVAAVVGDAQSRLSQPYEYDQDPCKLQAKVRFDKIDLKLTYDGKGPCDILESTFALNVNAQTRCFGQCGSCAWGPTIFDYFEKCNYAEVTSVYGVRCGEWSFSSLIGGTGTEFVVPLDGKDIRLRIETMFWDDDDRVFGRHLVNLAYPSIEKAQQELGCEKTFVTDTVGSMAADSQLTYTVAVYPNKCSEEPPKFGF